MQKLHNIEKVFLLFCIEISGKYFNPPSIKLFCPQAYDSNNKSAFKECLNILAEKEKNWEFKVKAFKLFILKKK